MSARHLVIASSLLALAALPACTSDDPQQLLQSGRQYLAQSDHAAAVIQLKNAVRAQPDNGEARLLLGRALLQVGDPAGADKELRRALELGQPPALVLPPLSQAMLQLGEHARLVEEFAAQKLDDAQAQADLQVALGDAYTQLRQLDNAAQAYRSALQLRADDARAQLGLAQIDALSGRFDAALVAVERVLQAAPKLPQAHALKSDILLVRGDRSAAQQALKDALAADAGYLPARFSLIASLVDDRDFAAAREQLKLAAQSAPGDIRVVYFEGVLAHRAGDLDNARAALAQVLKADPNHIPSLLLVASMDLQAAQTASAEAHLRRVLAAVPQHSEARRLLAMHYLRAGNPARARETIEPLLKTGAPVDPQILLLVGESHLADGDVRQASAYFQRVSTSENDRPRAMAHTRLGQIALATGKPEQGIRELETASQVDPELRHADLALVSNYLRGGEIDKALEVARRLEQSQPKEAITHQVMGTVHLARRDAPAARRSFERALELNPAFLPAARTLASMDIDEGRVDDARRRYSAMLKRDPNNARVHLALAELQMRSGAPITEVIPTLQRAVSVDATSLEARLALISALRQAGNIRAALSAAQQAVASHPDQPLVLQALAMLQEEAGEHHQAVETLRRLAQVQPASALPLQRLAAAHVRQKEYDKAIDALRLAKEIAPSELSLTRDLVAVMVMAQRPNDALREARSMQTAQPRSAAGWLLESQVHEAQKRAPEAERALRDALKAEPSSTAVAVRLHNLLLSSGKTGDAAVFTKRWLAEHPRDTALRIYLAERELAASDWKSAANWYQQVLSIEPNNVVALNNLAWTTNKLGDPAAMAHAERAVRLAPGNASVLDTMGVLLLERGEVERAVDFLGRAARIAPNRHDIRLNHAKALAKAGRSNQAKEELEALQRVPADFAGKSDIPMLLKTL